MSKKRIEKNKEIRDYALLDFSRQISHKFLLAEVEKQDGLLDILLYSSNTREAIIRKDQFDKDKKNGKCIIKDPCSDARSSGILNSYSTYSTASIGAAGDPSFFKPVYQDDGSNIIVTFPHYDGEESKTKEEMLGCAGIGVKRASMQDSKFLDSLPIGLVKYIEGEIHTDDPVQLAWLKALAISKLAPTKTVLAGILDQNTLELLIFGAVTNGGKEQYLTLDPKNGKDNYHYSEEKIIKTLRRADIQNSNVADHLMHVLELNRQQRDKLGTEKPGHKADQFKEKNKEQNPLIIHVSTEMPSIRNRFPGIVDSPNTCFSIRAPLTGMRRQQVMTEPVSNQADFPFMKAAHAFKEGGGAFYNTRTLLIEAKSEEVIRDIIESLKHTEYFREWLKNDSDPGTEAKPGGTVIVSLLNENGKVEGMSKLSYRDIYSGF